MGEGVTVDDCYKRWQSLRDQFVHEMKNVKIKKSGDPGPSYTSRWLLFDAVSFTVHHRQYV